MSASGLLVYDKRGTGRSGGAFSANFRVRAGDAAAAAAAVAARADVDRTRVGFAGYSQGGWVAPLAAQKFGAARANVFPFQALDRQWYWWCHSPRDRLARCDYV